MGGRGSVGIKSKGGADKTVKAVRQLTSLANAPSANYNLENKTSRNYSSMKALPHEVKTMEEGIRKEVWATKDAISNYRTKIQALRETSKRLGNTKEAKSLYKELKTKEVAKLKKQIKRLQFIKKSKETYDIYKVLDDKRLTSYKNPRG